MVGIAKRSDKRRLRAAVHSTRRDGAIAIALLVLPWVMVLGRSPHYLDVGTVGILAAVSLGLPTLWITWVAYRGLASRDASEQQANSPPVPTAAEG
jgi:hypothetical protein